MANERDLTLVIKARDAASQALRALENSFKALGGEIGKTDASSKKAEVSAAKLESQNKKLITTFENQIRKQQLLSDSVGKTAQEQQRLAFQSELLASALAKDAAQVDRLTRAFDQAQVGARKFAEAQKASQVMADRGRIEENLRREAQAASLTDAQLKRLNFTRDLEKTGLRATDQEYKRLLSTYDQVQQKIAALNVEESKGFGTTVGRIRQITAAVGAVAGLFATVRQGVQTFADLETGIAKIGTLIPGEIGKIREIDQATREIALSTGRSIQELQSAALEVVSSFSGASDVVERVRIVNDAAKAGLSDSKSTLELLSAVTKAYGDTSAEALRRVSDLGFRTADIGQTTFPELAGSIFRVTGASRLLGVSQEELFGVFAAATGVFGKASDVATGYSGILAQLLNPSQKLTELLRRQGVASSQALVAQKGFAGALKLIVEEAKRTNTPLGQLIGDVQGFNLAALLGGPIADQLAQSIEAVGNATGATASALEQFDPTLQKSLDKLSVVTTLIQEQLGKAFIGPTEGLTKLGQSFVDVLTKVEKTNPELLTFITQMGTIAVVTGVATGALALFTALPFGLTFAIISGGLTLATLALSEFNDEVDRLSDEKFRSIFPERGDIAATVEGLNSLADVVAKLEDAPALSDMQLKETLERGTAETIQRVIDSFKLTTDQFKILKAALNEKIDISGTQADLEDKFNKIGESIVETEDRLAQLKRTAAAGTEIEQAAAQLERLTRARALIGRQLTTVLDAPTKQEGLFKVQIEQTNQKIEEQRELIAKLQAELRKTEIKQPTRQVTEVIDPLSGATRTTEVPVEFDTNNFRTLGDQPIESAIKKSNDEIARLTIERGKILASLEALNEKPGNQGLPADEGQQKKIDREIKRFEDMIRSQEIAAEQIGKTSIEQARLNFQIQLGDSLIAGNVTQVNRLTAAFERALDLTIEGNIRGINMALDEQQEEIGLTREGIDRLNFARNLEQQGIERSSAEYEQLLARYDEIQEAQTRVRVAQEALNKTFEEGAINSLRDFADAAEDAGRRAADAIESNFSRVEDALTEFFQTGKVNVASFLRDIQAEIIRAQVRDNILGPIARSASGGRSGSGVLDAIGGVLGGLLGTTRDVSQIPGPGDGTRKDTATGETVGDKVEESGQQVEQSVNTIGQQITQGAASNTGQLIAQTVASSGAQILANQAAQALQTSIETGALNAQTIALIQSEQLAASAIVNAIGALQASIAASGGGGGGEAASGLAGLIANASSSSGSGSAAGGAAGGASSGSGGGGGAGAGFAIGSLIGSLIANKIVERRNTFGDAKVTFLSSSRGQLNADGTQVVPGERRDARRSFAQGGITPSTIDPDGFLAVLHPNEAVTPLQDGKVPLRRKGNGFVVLLPGGREIPADLQENGSRGFKAFEFGGTTSGPRPNRTNADSDVREGFDARDNNSQVRPIVNLSITTLDRRGFARSSNQIMSDAERLLRRASTRNGAR